ncbi:CRISPR-associated protein Cas5 [Streptomyces sp. NBC_00847]|uniref:CRISPR-associated protein Cas5 n=1 Tax=Streptomyces sp. NBC_00847 TaxID=2975850 RepID=UPI00224D8B28|nr:CRISPR-associated protein Cas5 [Streptomyces sp. NBC_00847]MCX4884655.1 CRISPR-associated protein Cas5 [Streptomyces sp. NBC_00847]
MPETIDALEVIVTAPVVSFRNPLYAGIQVGLPCPPPSTVGGLLAACAGTWDQVPRETRFAMAFHAEGTGVDLETYHPLAAKAANAKVTIKDRDFLTNATLTLWLTTDLELWEAAIRRPVWPLRLGRSQDLATARARRIQLTTGPGTQGRAVVPADLAKGGTLLQLPTAIAADRARTRWGTYRYASAGTTAQISTGLATHDGQAVALLPPAHPAHAA